MRSSRIDTLRGLAVFGILLVNIWSFSWGFQSFRYGALPPDATWADQAAVLFIAFVAEQKFYPIFAFLFGAGFALYAQSLGDAGAAGQAWRRRMTWLLACGVVHGTLVWFGDILTLYAIAGFLVLRPLVGAPIARVLTSLRRWTTAFVLLLAVMVMLAIFSLSLSLPDDTSPVQQLFASHSIYTMGSVGDIALERLGDFGSLMLQSALILPHVAVLFLLGVIAVRLGWLTDPERHAALWRATRRYGLLAGLPFNLAWAALALTEALDPMHPPAQSYLMYALLPLGGSALAAAYVAHLMLVPATRLQALTNWLAPVGRMALTNYLMQSVLCVLLLQGAGLGLGARMPHAAYPLVAAAIMLLQVFVSRWWLRSHQQGPLEAMYRARGRE